MFRPLGLAASVAARAGSLSLAPAGFKEISTFKIVYGMTALLFLLAAFVLAACCALVLAAWHAQS